MKMSRYMYILALALIIVTHQSLGQHQQQRQQPPKQPQHQQQQQQQNQQQYQQNQQKQYQQHQYRQQPPQHDGYDPQYQQHQRQGAQGAQAPSAANPAEDFNMFDYNYDGYVDAQEIRSSMAFNNRANDLVVFFMAADADNSGTISLDEYIAYLELQK